MSSFQQIGGAWERRDRNGNPFYSVKVTLPDGTEQTLMLFPNKFKLNSQDGRPDFVAYMSISEPEPAEEHPF